MCTYTYIKMLYITYIYISLYIYIAYCLCTICIYSMCSMCNVCTVCMHSMYAQYVCTVVTDSIQYLFYNLHSMYSVYPVPSTWYLVLRIHPCHPYAFICIRHASLCSHMPPYAVITHPNANIQFTFSQKKTKKPETRDKLAKLEYRKTIPDPTQYSKSARHM